MKTALLIDECINDLNSQIAFSGLQLDYLPNYRLGFLQTLPLFLREHALAFLIKI